MEEKKVEACADRLFNEMNAGMSCLNLHVDHRLGLFQALADAGSATSRDISHSTGYVERYVREWLEFMTAGRYLTHDADFETLSLPEEHIAALLDPTAHRRLSESWAGFPASPAWPCCPSKIRSSGSTG